MFTNLILKILYATIFLGILFDINDDHFRTRILHRYDLTLQSKNIHFKQHIPYPRQTTTVLIASFV